MLGEQGCVQVCVCECDHECDRQKDLSVILTISSFLQRNEVWLAVIFWRALLNQPQLPSHPLPPPLMTPSLTHLCFYSHSKFDKLHALRCVAWRPRGDGGRLTNFTFFTSGNSWNRTNSACCCQFA